MPGAPAAELCGNGIDDNCDGDIDEGFPVGDACTVGVGACSRDGVNVCTGDRLGIECHAVAGDPADEICDNVDNDCDGEVDEGFEVGLICEDVSGCAGGASRVTCDDGCICMAHAGPCSATASSLSNPDVLAGKFFRYTGRNIAVEDVWADDINDIRERTVWTWEDMEGGQRAEGLVDGGIDGEPDKLIVRLFDEAGRLVEQRFWTNPDGNGDPTILRLFVYLPDGSGGYDEIVNGDEVVEWRRYDRADEQPGYELRSNSGRYKVYDPARNLVFELTASNEWSFDYAECREQCGDAGEPVDEICDGLDNDCDGETDEDLGQVTCGDGVCARTVDACVDSQPQQCVPDETCDDFVVIAPTLGNWNKTFSGNWAESADGIRVFGTGNRTGNSIVTESFFDFSDSETYIKWQANGAGNYAGFAIGVMGVAAADGMSTGHSYAGSSLLSENTWHYTRIRIAPNRTFVAVTSLGGYDSNGGDVFRTDSGAIDERWWGYIEKTAIFADMGDNYGSTQASIFVGEAATTAIPVEIVATRSHIFDFEGGSEIPAGFGTPDDWTIDAGVGHDSSQSLHISAHGAFELQELRP